MMELRDIRAGVEALTVVYPRERPDLNPVFKEAARQRNINLDVAIAEELLGADETECRVIDGVEYIEMRYFPRLFSLGDPET